MNESAELQRLIHHAAPLKSAEQTQEVFQAHGVVRVEVKGNVCFVGSRSGPISLTVLMMTSSIFGAEQHISERSSTLVVHTRRRRGKNTCGPKCLALSACKHLQPIDR